MNFTTMKEYKETSLEGFRVNAKLGMEIKIQDNFRINIEGGLYNLGNSFVGGFGDGSDSSSGIFKFGDPFTFIGISHSF